MCTIQTILAVAGANLITTIIISLLFVLLIVAIVNTILETLEMYYKDRESVRKLKMARIDLHKQRLIRDAMEDR